jgi:hypothetical protein
MFNAPCVFVRLRRIQGPVFPVPDDATYKGQSKIGLNNTIKIRFICSSERFVDNTIAPVIVTARSPQAALKIRELSRVGRAAPTTSQIGAEFQPRMKRMIPEKSLPASPLSA